MVTSISGRPSYKVVLVDDEPFYSRPLVDELAGDFDVSYYRKADAGLRALTHNEDRIVAILDVMMPPPSAALEIETEGGMTTGIWLLVQISEMIAKTKSSVLLLTNRDYDVVVHHLEVANLPNIDVNIILKRSAPPARLREMVRDRFEHWKVEGEVR
jgi:DNA-binding NarL/FixJ family response regulator